MTTHLTLFLRVWIKFFFLFTPFFALSMFLSMTEGFSENRRRKLALLVSGAVLVLCLVLFFLGNQLFSLFGITLDSFRIGAGALLFLSAVGLVQGNPAEIGANRNDSIAVVPLAMSFFVGPATTGTLLVLGADLNSLTTKGVGCLALLFAVACLGIVLLLGTLIQRTLGDKGIGILSKLTGLILAALSAQIIMTGIQGFMRK